MSFTIEDRIIEVFRPFHAGETACDEKHFREKLRSFTDHGLPIPFVIAAFPWKSINDDSVSGHLPDFGELLALQNLRDLVDRVSMVYAPGMKLHVFSDGHCFFRAGCVRPIEQIDAYVAEISRMKDSDRIILHTIRDFYPAGNIEEKITAFESEYVPSNCEIIDAIKNDTYFARSYPDRIAFIYREFSRFLFPGLSSMKRQALSRIIARSFIARQIATSRLIKDRFADHIRLSIHQQHDARSQKYYINLLPQVEGKGTPWFHVVVKDGDALKVMKKYQAETKTSVQGSVMRNYTLTGIAQVELMEPA
jgi:pyoverdine/dityrosine biosynthesis protein Dit1